MLMGLLLFHIPPLLLPFPIVHSRNLHGCVQTPDSCALSLPPACNAHTQVLDAFTDTFSFASLSFEAGIRLYLESFR